MWNDGRGGGMKKKNKGEGKREEYKLKIVAVNVTFVSSSDEFLPPRPPNTAI